MRGLLFGAAPSEDGDGEADNTESEDPVEAHLVGHEGLEAGDCSAVASDFLGDSPALAGQGGFQLGLGQLWSELDPLTGRHGEASVHEGLHGVAEFRPGRDHDHHLAGGVTTHSRGLGCLCEGSQGDGLLGRGRECDQKGGDNKQQGGDQIFQLFNVPFISACSIYITY